MTIFESGSNSESSNFSGKVIKISSSDKIFSHKDYSDKISVLKALDLVNNKLFDEFYWHLFTNFVDYLQMLPDPRQHNWPLINVALARAKVAFSHVANHKDQRFQLAYISLAVFSDLGACVADYSVLITDADGKVLDQFNPLMRGLSDYEGYYYKLRLLSHYPKTMRYDVNPILACKIMPEIGLKFLQEDPVMFSQWLRALAGKPEEGDFAAVLDTTRAFPKNDVIANLDPSLVSSDMYGDAENFWLWVQKNLEKKKNYEVANGDFMLDVDSLVKEYSSVNNVDVASVKRQLKSIRVVDAAKVGGKKAAGNKGYSCSLFTAKSADESRKYKVQTTVANNAKTYVVKGSLKDFSERNQSGLQLESDKNQQLT